ncbi:MAG: hypothetical protein GAK43_02233 [Stenotrophomonas maltophilia]|nr:MAG: hypothetical protein GAK43_02233 [Stenotrophomonas maltophilia]
MKEPMPLPDDAEATLLAHYRQHDTAQPPATLDAAILAAARQHARPNPRLTAWQRLLHWLAAGSRPRWSMALAGLATLGVGLSLTLRNLDAPPLYDAPLSSVATPPAPAALPAPAPAPAPKASALFGRLEAKREAAKPSIAQDMAEATAPAAEPPAEPHASLLLLRSAQREGRTGEVQRLRKALAERFPQLDIDAELAHLKD